MCCSRGAQGSNLIYTKQTEANYKNSLSFPNKLSWNGEWFCCQAYICLQHKFMLPVSFIIAEMKHCATQGEDMAHRLGSKWQFEVQCEVMLGGTNANNKKT